MLLDKIHQKLMELDVKTGIKIVFVLLAVFLVGSAMLSPVFGKQIATPDTSTTYAAEAVEQRVFLPII